MTSTERKFTSVEICAGAGGQAVGLHNALFRHLALIEVDPHACETLRKNVVGNKEWGGCEVMEEDLTQLKPVELRRHLKLNRGTWISWQGAFRARRSLLPGSSWGRMTSGICFPSCSSLWKNSSPKL